MSKRTKVIAAAIAAVVLIGGFAVWYLVFRDDAPEEFTLGTERTTTSTTGALDGTESTASTTSATTAPSGPATLDGTWTATVPDDGGAGYRIEEVISGINKTAVARSQSVTGQMTVADGSVTSVDITVDMTQLQSTDDTPGTERRDNFVRTNALETDRFEEATFALRAPVTIGDTTAGASRSFEAEGTLTLHGVSRDVTVPMQARLNQDGTIDVVGSAPIALADYGITPPDLGFVKVEGNGTMEFKLRFAKA